MYYSDWNDLINFTNYYQVILCLKCSFAVAISSKNISIGNKYRKPLLYFSHCYMLSNVSKIDPFHPTALYLVTYVKLFPVAASVTHTQCCNSIGTLPYALFGRYEHKLLTLSALG